MGKVFWPKKGRYGKSTAQRFSSSIDNPQKDNFHNLILSRPPSLF
jgi:hypothetical protein